MVQFSKEFFRELTPSAQPTLNVPEKSSASQIPCEIGTYQDKEGQSDCNDATEGYYVPKKGSTSQIPCEIGTYQDKKGQSDCIDASEDHFVPVIGSTSQTPCENGTYQDERGQTSCKKTATKVNLRNAKFAYYDTRRANNIGDYIEPWFPEHGAWKAIDGDIGQSSSEDHVAIPKEGVNEANFFVELDPTFIGYVHIWPRFLPNIAKYK